MFLGEVLKNIPKKYLRSFSRSSLTRIIEKRLSFRVENEVSQISRNRGQNYIHQFFLSAAQKIFLLVRCLLLLLLNSAACRAARNLLGKVSKKLYAISKTRSDSSLLASVVFKNRTTQTPKLYDKVH